MSVMDLVSKEGKRIPTQAEELKEKTFRIQGLIDQIDTFDRLRKRMQAISRKAPKVLPMNENDKIELREYMIEMDLAENVYYAQLVTAIIDRNITKRKYYDSLGDEEVKVKSVD